MNLTKLSKMRQAAHANLPHSGKIGGLRFDYTGRDLFSGDRAIMRRSSLDWLKDRSDEYIFCRHRKAVARDEVFFET